MISQNKTQETNKEQSKEKSLLDQFMKPEQASQALPFEWRLQKKRKKKSKGLHS